jgi:hypothetical protein
MATGMSVPGATDLGLGATTPGPESDEERRKRLLQQQQQRLVPGMSGSAPSDLMAGYGAAFGV